MNSNVPTYGTRPAFFARAWVQPDMTVTYVEYPEFAEWLRQWEEASLLDDCARPRLYGAIH